jgi:hypothetical protein
MACHHQQPSTRLFHVNRRSFHSNGREDAAPGRAPQARHGPEEERVRHLVGRRSPTRHRAPRGGRARPRRRAGRPTGAPVVDGVAPLWSGTLRPWSGPGRAVAQPAPPPSGAIDTSSRPTGRVHADVEGLRPARSRADAPAGAGRWGRMVTEAPGRTARIPLIGTGSTALRPGTPSRLGWTGSRQSITCGRAAITSRGSRDTTSDSSGGRTAGRRRMPAKASRQLPP